MNIAQSLKQLAAITIFSSSIFNVTLVGRFAQATQYYPVTFEKDRYTTFGFTKGVNEMNQSGRDFMVNLAFFVGRFDL